MGESDLAKEFFYCIDRKSHPDEIRQKYYAYQSYLRNLACFRKPDYSQLEEVEKKYNDWKRANNIQ